MSKRRKVADISIGKRAYQEVLRLFPKMKDAESALGVKTTLSMSGTKVFHLLQST